jgi:hypothetical protein
MESCRRVFRILPVPNERQGQSRRLPRAFGSVASAWRCFTIIAHGSSPPRYAIRFQPDCGETNSLVGANVGRVGAAMKVAEAAAVRSYLAQRMVDRCSFTPPPPRALVGPRARWVFPELLLEVEYLERTDDGGLRHPIFKGIRVDDLAITGGV